MSELRTTPPLSTSPNLVEAKLLLQASQEIAKANDANEVLRIALINLKKWDLMPAIYVANGEGLQLLDDVLQKPGITGNFPSQLNISPQEIGTVFPTSKPLLITEVTSPEDLWPSDILSVPRKLNFETAAYIPIREKGKLIAVLMLGSLENMGISPATLEVYAGFVEYIESMLERINKHNSLEQQIANLEKLIEFGHTVGGEFDLEKFFPIIHNQIEQFVGDVTFYIALYNEETEHISFPYVHEQSKIQSIDPIPLGVGLTSIVVRTRKPLILLENTEQKAVELGAKVIGPAAKSWLGVPLLLGSRVIGVMTIQDSNVEHRFSEDDLQLMTTLAAQVVGAINTTRLLNESHQFAIQLETASSIAKETGRISDRATLLKRVINMVKDRFGFYHASVFLVDPTKEFATIKESTGEAGGEMVEQNFKLKVGSQSVIGHVTSSGEPLIINNVTDDPMYQNNPLLPDTQAEAGIPMKIGTRVVGALNIKSTQPYSFSHDVIEVLQIIADQLAVAVSNAALFEEIHETLSKQHIVHSVTTNAVSATKLNDVLSSTVDELQKSLGDKVAILLIEADSNYMRLTSSTGYEEDILGLEIEVGKGITGWVAANREPLLVNDVLNDERYIPGSDQVRSEVAVPLIFRGDLLGVLNLESNNENAFSASDLDVLASIANNLSAIIVNTRISERQRDLFTITNKIRGSADIGTILETTADELTRVLKTRKTKIEVGVGLIASKPVKEASIKSKIDDIR